MAAYFGGASSATCIAFRARNAWALGSDWSQLLIAVRIRSCGATFENDADPAQPGQVDCIPVAVISVLAAACRPRRRHSSHPRLPQHVIYDGRRIINKQ